MIAKRITALITKELLTLFRDPKARVVLVIPPLIQLFIFSFAATLEVKNTSIVIFNQDIGKHSLEIINRIRASKNFSNIYFASNFGETSKAIDEQKAIASINIPQNLSSSISNKKPIKIQIVLDGRKSNAAQIVNGYLSQIIKQYSLELSPISKNQIKPINIIERNWFNENLLYIWFTVPSLMGTLSMLVALMITSLSVARERELGTFEQLLVSPLMPYEILIGKTIPAIIVSMVEAFLIWLISVFIFKIPFLGSLFLLFFAILIFILSIVGVGLFISSISKTQQQSVLGTFIFMVPATTLSGFASPVENMPLWLQKLTYINPLKHLLITIKGLFLKDMPFIEVWTNTYPLLIIGITTLIITGWFFTKRLE
ncbi:MAG: ABC transporter permease [Alphaproteobacteria bacterium]